MGVPRTAIGDWIKDHCPPRRKYVPRLASILGLDPRVLTPFYDADDGAPARPLRASEPGKRQSGSIERPDVAALRMAIDIVKEAEVPTSRDPNRRTEEDLKVLILDKLEARMKELAAS